MQWTEAGLKVTHWTYENAEQDNGESMNTSRNVSNIALKKNSKMHFLFLHVVLKDMINYSLSVFYLTVSQFVFWREFESKNVLGPLWDI